MKMFKKLKDSKKFEEDADEELFILDDTEEALHKPLAPPKRLARWVFNELLDEDKQRLIDAGTEIYD